MGGICICYNDDNESIISQAKDILEFEKEYKIGSIIGIGEFSEVKKAEGPKGLVALKCINLAKIRNELHLLKREISIMHKIKHPHIIEFYDVYENTENFYITMEFCNGMDLKTKVKKHGAFSEPEAKDLTRKLLSALVYLHNQHICHRDLKPENILFDCQEPKIADFGLARLMSGTSKFSMVGTPYYLAPEVISGDYNLKCDV